MNSTLGSDCLQSLMELSKKKNAASARDRKFEGDKIVDRLTETGSKYPFTGHELSCIISDRTAKRVVRDWMERKHQEIWKSTP